MTIASVPAAVLMAVVAMALAIRTAVPRPTEIVSGLTNPRAIAPLDDGFVIVEAGTGHADGRIARVVGGAIEVLADRLPSYPYTPTEIVGPAAARLDADALYWLQGLGHDALSGTLVRRRDGRVEMVASLKLAAQSAPDGDTTIANPFDMVMADDGALYVSDASANLIWRVAPDGAVRQHVIWTAIENPVPTGLARGPDGALYVALFSPEPHARGAGRVVRFDAAGRADVVVRDLTLPIALDFDRAGRMLVLEFASRFDPTEPFGFAAGSGRVLRIDGARRDTLWTGLDYPTDLIVGRDRALYVTRRGAFGAPGSGSLARLPTRR
ncbi:MAG: ScyD/ScyE family protein [Chloroflexota bacterium]|nr:MAG: ScyD/ScyE family protein [Chloroflexota bacterium]